ncbi:MAG: CRISPR-associated ring nuclease Csm6 [Syntrophales bacterium]|nr:CRISPR-associated ring nuclease Csm6 [Syntrophales bacterium]
MKTTLLAVVGLSPQVLTETLYSLHRQNVHVNAIRVITTRPGRDTILSALLAKPDGHFWTYIKEYGIDEDAIAFGPESIHCVAHPDGELINDILDEEDNVALMNCCLEEAFHLTSQEDTRVIFSIAGGRKTMSACLLSAAVLYGRKQDLVCHVLVSPEFENHPAFFYPPKTSIPLTLRDHRGNPYIKETRYAQLHLVEIPFVGVRGFLDADLLKEPLDPATVQNILLRRRQSSPLVCDLTKGTITWRGITAAMMPAHLALYAFFLLRKRDVSCGRERCQNCWDCYLEFAELTRHQEQLTGLYRRIHEHDRDLNSMSDSGILGLDPDNFRSYKAKIRSRLLVAFGAGVDRKLPIEGRGKKPDPRYGVPLDRGKIRVVL